MAYAVYATILRAYSRSLQEVMGADYGNGEDEDELKGNTVQPV